MDQSLKLKSKILLKNSFVLFLLFFLVACNTGLKETIKQVEDLDAKYNVELSNYKNGLTWFDTHAREPIPLNQEELSTLITELDKLKQGREGVSLDYIEFRINLFQAEKQYKSASRRPFAAYNSAIRCSKKDLLLLSFAEAKESVSYMEKAMDLFPKLKKNINLGDSWLDVIKKDNELILGVVYEKEDIIKEFCTKSLQLPSEN